MRFRKQLPNLSFLYKPRPDSGSFRIYFLPFLTFRGRQIKERWSFKEEVSAETSSSS